MEINVNVKNKKNHQIYTSMLQLIHTYMQSNGYFYAEVPILSPVLIPESYLDIFATKFRYFSQEQELYLIPSPELFLKRLIVSGIGNCYSLVKCFRNSEPTSSKHSPEFTMLEFYNVGGNYMTVADKTLGLLQYLAANLFDKQTINYQGKTITLDRWEKISVTEAFKRYANIENVLEKKALFQQAKQKGYTTDGFTYTDIWSQIYTQEVEPHLGTNGRPTLIYDYPKDLAAMVKFNSERNVAERFEFYIEGIELGNCGNENIEPDEIKPRIETEYALRGKDKYPFKPDMEFADILIKLPQCSGIAIGVERLAMLFADLNSIHDLQVVNIK